MIKFYKPSAYPAAQSEMNEAGQFRGEGEQQVVGVCLSDTGTSRESRNLAITDMLKLFQGPETSLGF